MMSMSCVWNLIFMNLRSVRYCNNVHNNICNKMVGPILSNDDYIGVAITHFYEGIQRWKKGNGLDSKF